MKKPITTVTELSHVSCSACGGLISKNHFSSHKRHCLKSKSIYTNETQNSINSSFLLPKYDNKYNILKETIFSNMNKDEIAFVAQSDPLILEFGRRFLNGHLHDNQKNYVSCKMRTLATILVRLKKADPSNIKGMEDCVNPKNFDLLCEITKKWCGYDEQKGICKTGSVPTRL